MTKTELEVIVGKCYAHAASRMAAHDHGGANDWRQAGKAIEFLMANQKKPAGRPRKEGAVTDG